MLKLEDKNYFFGGYILMLAGEVFSNISFIANYAKILTYLGFLLLLILIFKNRNKYTKKEIILFLICFLLLFFVSVVSKAKKMLKLWALIVAFKEINFDEFISKDFKYRFLFLLIVILLNFFGLTYHNNVIRPQEGFIRYSLGFQHPNNFAVYTMMLVLEYVYLNRNANNIKKQVLFIVMVLLVNYFLNNSRTAIIIEFLILIYILIPKNKVNKLLDKNIVQNLIKNSFVILLLLSLFLSMYYSIYSCKWLNKINEVTSNRFLIANVYMKKYPLLTLFGNEVNDAVRYINNVENPNYLPLDNGYVHLIIEFGILVTIVFIYLYYFSIKKLYIQKNYILIFIILLLNFYLIMEATVYNPIYNPFMLIFSITFYDLIFENNKNKPLSKKSNYKEINDLIIDSADQMIEEIKQNGFVLAGNNGPYNCLDTPVRNSSHWISIYKYLYLITKNKKYYDIINTLAKYLLSQKSKSGAIQCMNDDKFDKLNGNIGQAWAIEGLISAYQVTKNKDYYDKAVEIFLSQKYDYKNHLWKKVDLNAQETGYDKVFNHQLWFAATGFQIVNEKNNSEIFKQIDDFMKNIDSKFDVYDNGLLYHYIKGMENNKKSWKNYVKKLLFFLRYFNPRFDLKELEKGYHIFDLYGFAIIYNLDKSYDVFYSNKFKKAVKYAININKINNDSNIDLLLNGNSLFFKTNKFLYQYNSPAFEFPYIDFTFNHSKKENIYYELFDKQVKYTYNNKDKKFNKNNNDGNTLTARLYELTNYLEKIK